jgi:hypothetical protein
MQEQLDFDPDEALHEMAVQSSAAYDDDDSDADDSDDSDGHEYSFTEDGVGLIVHDILLNIN